MLSFDAVGKRYRSERWVLHDVDLDVAAGAVTAIVGGNGSGKSTLLRIMAGVSRPTRGKVSGRPPGVGYVPDRFPADERMSALAYLTHFGRIRGLSSQASRGRAHDLLDRLALEGGKDTPLRTLSKGNAQKVALSQAVLVPPQLLVLDEPWSGLDVSAHGVLAGLIAEAAGSGAAVVFTDHRESFARSHASQLYRVRDGCVHRVATDPSSDRPLTEVTLAPLDGRAQPTDWDALGGVVDVTRRAESVCIRVSGDCSDDLLRIALRHGWSVTGVATATQQDRSSKHIVGSRVH